MNKRQWAIVQAALRNLNNALHAGLGINEPAWDEGDDEEYGDGPEPTSAEIDAIVLRLAEFVEAMPADEERTLFQVSVAVEGDTHRRFKPHSKAAREYFGKIAAQASGWRRQLQDLIVPEDEAPTFAARLREEKFVVKVDEREPKFHVRVSDEGEYIRFNPCTQAARERFHTYRALGWNMEGEAILIPSNLRIEVEKFVLRIVSEIGNIVRDPEPLTAAEILKLRKLLLTT